MTTAYTSLLGLALPVTGELSGTWGDTVNDYITQYLDASVAGTQTISGSQTAVTLSKTTNASLSQAGSGATGSSQYNVINCTGNPASMLTVTVPAASKTYVVVNATSTNQDVKIVGAGPTTGVTLAAGEKAIIAWNGSDFIKIATSTADGVTTLSFGSTGLTPSTATSGAVTVAGTLVAANGGTGQSSYTTGDLLYATGSTALSKLGIGTNGQILTSTGTAPQWSTLSGVAVTTFSAGTTGFTPSTATSGAVTLAGTLATTNGGTGLTSFTANRVFYASSTSAIGQSANLTFDGTTLTANALTTTSTVTINGGTANGVAYLNGSKVLTTGSALTFDGTNLGVGVVGPHSLLSVAPGTFGANSNTVGCSFSLDSTSASQPISGFRFTGASSGLSSIYVTQWVTDSSNSLATEIYNTGTTPIVFGINSTEQMRLTSTGLGIGTSSPAYKLDVAGANAQSIRVTSTNGDLANLVMNSTGNASWSLSSDTVMRFKKDSTEYMRLDSSGNLGIGTTSPVSRLQVGNGTGLQQAAISGGGYDLYLGASGGAIFGFASQAISTVFNTASVPLGIGTNAAQPLIFGTGGTEKMRLDSSGNLGLGVTPSAWGSPFLGAFEGKAGTALVGRSDAAQSFLFNNLYFNGTNYIRKATGYGNFILLDGYSGGIGFNIAGTGSGGTTASPTQAMTLDASGNLGVGTTSPIAKLTALGAGTINAPETSTTGASIQTASYGITTRTGNLDLGATDALAANIGGSLTFSARYSGTNAAWVTGKVGAYRETATSGVASSYLAFATTTSAGDLTERARITSAGTFQLTNNYQEGVLTANTGTAYTIDLVNGTLQILTLTGNCTFTFPTATAGQSFTMLLRQDGTGGRTVTWPAAVRWPGNTAPTITSTASQTDKYIFTADGTRWYGSNAGQAYVA